MSKPTAVFAYISAGSLPPKAANGVTDGTRTHNSRNHNPAPYQLGDGHTCCPLRRQKFGGPHHMLAERCFVPLGRVTRIWPLDSTTVFKVADRYDYFRAARRGKERRRRTGP